MYDLLSKELKRKLISTTIAFILFVVVCIVTVVCAKLNTEKMSSPQETDISNLYDN